MYIIAGLGNPGRQYEQTRHNCGFRTIDILAERWKIDVNERRFKALCGVGFVEGRKTLLLKPQTFMNLSGEAVQEALAFYKADPSTELVVICDDVALPVGRIRVRMKGSAGGHNGLKNIIQMIGTDAFMRVRVGVGAKTEGWDMADYVLGRFPLSEQVPMIEAFETASRAAAALISEDPQKVMSEYNRKTTDE